MAIDFPNSPNQNDIYTLGSTTWTFDGQKWVITTSGRSGPSAVVVSDSSPISPSSGTLWYNSTNGKTYAYYTDVDTSQWVEVGNADPTFNTLTTKGDILTRSSSSMTRLGVGSDNQILSANSSLPNGIEWVNRPWNSAWGFVGGSKLNTTFNTSATHTTFQDTGLTMTISVNSSRLYRLTLAGNYYPSGGLQTMVANIVWGGSEIVLYNITPDGLNSGNSLALTNVFYYQPLTTGSVIVKSQLRAGVSNTTVSDYAAGTQYRLLLVEDMGPA